MAPRKPSSLLLVLAFSSSAVLATPPLSPECDDEAVTRIAELLLELPRAGPDRLPAIGPEVARWLRTAVDLDPDREPDAFREAAEPCLAAALARARASLAPAAEPAHPALDAARRAATLSRMRAVQVALHAHAAESDALPSTEEGLGDLVERGVLRREDVLDGWGRIFIYRREQRDPWAFELTSAGPDGVPHTADDVALGWP